MTQAEAIDLMMSGASIFLTGEPGAGKTYTLNQFIEKARAADKRIAITASTGIAASHINGVTIHSWSGLGIADSITDAELDRMSYKSFLRDKYNRCDILIIDEISMLHNYRLDMIERACRWVRNRFNDPFGGLQVILVGDLFQLPPVTRDSFGDDYVHQSEAWNAADLKVAYLTEQHRQGADDQLLTILRQMRTGDLSVESRQRLASRQRPSDDDSITRLYTHNVDVDALNRKKLDELEGKHRTFHMKSSGDKYRSQAMRRNILAPEALELKVGAEVMFVANNWDEGFVNGTRGRVTGFTGSGEPQVETVDGNFVTVEKHTWKAFDDLGQYVVAEVSQYPLRLAWAVTIHKSQGMSLDAAEIDLGKAFAPGMGYVALSRVRSLEGLYLLGLGEQAFAMDQDIRKFDKLLRKGRSK
jgi:ATP-dependent exoDNAse (exonuclease V) alpha subunit